MLCVCRYRRKSSNIRKGPKMIPFDFQAPSILWYQTWRSHICKAKMIPEQVDGYCRAALIAHSEYEMWRAIEVVEYRKRYSNG